MLHGLYWLNFHQLRGELRCLDPTWTPSIKCQIFFVIISHWIASRVYWIRSHRPQVDKGTITVSCTSQRSPSCCFLLRTFKKKKKQNTRYLPSRTVQSVLWKSSAARTQRLQSIAQKIYSGRGHNSCCQTTTIIQPPCTLPLRYYLTQLNIKQKVVAKPRI